MELTGKASLIPRLQDLRPVVAEIVHFSGAAGLSLGVLHHGEIIHFDNFGHRDISLQQIADENTSYIIGSLTKAMTAAMVGILVDEGKLSWKTPLGELLPEYEIGDLTLVDLLSHRSGLPGLDALWLRPRGVVGIGREDALRLLRVGPPARSVRSDFLYNNLAYEVVGQVIEKVSGESYADYMENRILRPLHMDNTYYTSTKKGFPNRAKPYACLQDMSQVNIDWPLTGINVAFGAAGGIRSSVRDLLTVYKAFIEAANNEFGEGKLNGRAIESDDNPLKQLSTLWYPMMSLPPTTLREHSYALGWCRAQLPHALGLPGSEYITVGEGSPSHTILYHEGRIPGFLAFTALLPETSSAVVVLSNGMGMAEPTKIIAALLLDTILGVPRLDPQKFLKKAVLQAERGAGAVSRLFSAVRQGKTVDKPVRSLDAYVGTYYHPSIQFCIRISVSGEKLKATFRCGEKDGEMVELEPYGRDSFFWQMEHDEVARGGWVIWAPEHYILRFGISEKLEGCGDGVCVGYQERCLRWKFDLNLPTDGVAFCTRPDQTHR
ncbi:putative D-aminoacylase [Terfezia claveryi]|nr:putative D-aminoacylase [Terfezia claveryi]